MEYDHAGLCNLLAALFNLAHRDARQGSEDAINFLDCTVPTWRDVARRQQRVAEKKSQVVEDRGNGIRVTKRGQDLHLAHAETNQQVERFTQ